MINEIIKNIVEDIEYKEQSSDKPKFTNPKYEVSAIDKNEFKEINETENLKIAFIDGGNGEILKAANFCLQFIRVAAITMQKKETISKKIYEFYCLVLAKQEEDDIYYDAKIFPVKGERLIEDFSINSMDSSIKNGKFRASISIIPQVVRKFAEHKICLDVMDADIIVKDGTLETCYTGEEELLKQIYETADNNNTIMSALAKTSTLFTEKGNNLLGLLNNLNNSEKWLYPIATINASFHKANIYGVKLSGNYVFRFELHKGNLNIVLGNLLFNSRDSAFKGYPYGLVLADQFARVSNKEIEYFKTIFETKFNKHWEKILKYQNSLSAHSVLDSI